MKIFDITLPILLLFGFSFFFNTVEFHLPNPEYLPGNVLSKFIHVNDSFDEFNRLVSLVKKIPGDYSIYIKDVKSNRSYKYNIDQKYYAASLFKLPVGIAVLHQVDLGNVSLSTKLKYLPQHFADGTGVINQSPYGTEYTIDELLGYLFKQSDNVAQNMLLDYLDVNSDSVSSVFPDGGKTDYYHVNNSGAGEIGEYLSFIYTSDFLSEDSKSYLINVMKDTSFDYLLADYISVPFSNKIGLSGGSIHSCGIIPDKSLVLCVMSGRTGSTRFMEVSKLLGTFINSL